MAVKRVERGIRPRGYRLEDLTEGLNHEVIPLLIEMRTRMNELIDQGPVAHGTATITHPATSVAVTFTTPLTTANYKIAHSVRQSGAGAAGSRTTLFSSLATTGFTVAIDAAPGAGVSTFVDWMVFVL